MAALNRPTEATYVIHDEVSVETSDHQDHTFCGIMFPVKCKDNLPVDHIMIHSIAIRGRLGPLTVWVSSEEDQIAPTNLRRFHLNPRHWNKIYEKSHRPSFQAFQSLDLSENPIILRPGQVKAIYIHSTLDGDEAIVYDNRHNRRTYDDKFISILTGRAHVSNTPFGTTPIWGWGNAWREPREFVGRVDYGAVYKLWNPSQAHLFGDNFQTLVRTILLCQRRWESIISRLPDDCIFYILNMCRWDWAMDTPQDMKLLKKRRLNRIEAAANAAAAVAEAPVTSDTAPDSHASESMESQGHVATQSTCCTQEQAPSSSESREQHVESDDESLLEAEENDISITEENDISITELGINDILANDDDDDVEELDDDDDEYNPVHGYFTFQDEDSDDETMQDEDDTGLYRHQNWVRRQFARIHVLRAMVRLDDQRVSRFNTTT